MITEEQYEKLKPWETALNNAVDNKFVHMTMADFKQVAAIYTEITGTILRPSQMNCNTCRLNTLTKLGQMYREYIKPKEEKKKTNRGRPKAIKEDGEKQE